MVTGRNGAFKRAKPFTVSVGRVAGKCDTVAGLDQLVARSHDIPAGPYTSLILVDTADPTLGSAGDIYSLNESLKALAASEKVNGKIIDLSIAGINDARINAAREQAQTFFECPYAQNVYATAIKELIDEYRAASTIETEYIVLVGNDQAIPFFRYADMAPIGKESEYNIPILQNNISHAALVFDYILSQDAYGSDKSIQLQENELPIPNLPVGRLVETAADVSFMIDTYLAGTGGLTPQNAFLSTYEFLADGSDVVAEELRAGMNNDKAVTLLTDAEKVWSADDMRAQWLNKNRYDLSYLAGHFSHLGADAADYVTRVTTNELVDSGLDLTNTVNFSSGCHSGYNLVNPHAGIVYDLDWAQAFAQKGGHLIAGTGFQYGDADLTEYGERLYINFARELRTGQPVPIGKALVAAKQEYLLDTTVEIDGVFEKTILVSTLFGLPMFEVTMEAPSEPREPVAMQGIVQPGDLISELGSQTGLQYADITQAFNLTRKTKALETIDGGEPLQAVYYAGDSGHSTRSGFPIMPIASFDVSHPEGNESGIVRGVGIRGGTYTSETDVFPLTSQANTEEERLHEAFRADFFYPVKQVKLNYFGALIDESGGETRMNVVPAQYKSNSAAGSRYLGTMITYSNMDFRIYYNKDMSENGRIGPASIAKVYSNVNPDGSVSLRVQATEPRLGVHELWVLYTGTLGSGLHGEWVALDLGKNSAEMSEWRGTITVDDLNGTDPASVRFMVQAVNAVGMVTLDANNGEFYKPDVDPADLSVPTEGGPQLVGTKIEFTAPISGSFGSNVTVFVTLTNAANQEPIADEWVHISLGDLTFNGITNAEGKATIDIPVVSLPDAGDEGLEIQVDYAGSDQFDESLARQPFEVNKQPTSLTFEAGSDVETDEPWGLVLSLLDGEGRAIPERFVSIVLTNTKTNETFEATQDTNQNGQTILNELLGQSVPDGTYTVQANFEADDYYLASSANTTLSIGVDDPGGPGQDGGAVYLPLIIR